MIDQSDSKSNIRADELVARPVESLNVEVKTWLDPQKDDHVAKFVKALFALRNRNGGFLVIGINNTTLDPDPCSLGKPLTEVYHHDVVQGIVSRYAHETFEVEVLFGHREGSAHPVIRVPEGVRTPVAVSRDLLDIPPSKPLLNKGDIYFRTLQSNGTPSSSRIMPTDLRSLMEICFDNREADIGRFFRRQLGSGGGDALHRLLGAPPMPSEAEQLKSRAAALISRGDAAFGSALAARPLPPNKLQLLNALTMRVGMVASPLRAAALPTDEFMARVRSANPQYTGWPAWLDARGFRGDQRARVENGAWVTDVRNDSVGGHARLEFMLYDPRGEFFVRRAMQDDTVGNVTPGTVLDPMLMIYRVAEFIAAGISVLRGTGWSESDKAGFAFSWSGLHNRKLNSWANAMRFYGPGDGYTSHTATANSFVELALDTPHLALAPVVETAVGSLFACFDGYQPPASLVEECVRGMVERKM